MPYATTHVRLGLEAGRALIGLWFIVVTLVGAQPLYRWLELRHARPELALLSAIGLALLACVGIGLVAVAVFRSLMHAIAPRAVGEKAALS